MVQELSAFTFNLTTNLPDFVNTWTGFTALSILVPSPKSQSEVNVFVA